MADVNQSQFNKSRLDKFLLVLNLPPVLKDLNKKDFKSRDNDVVIENSLQFSVYGAIVPKVAVPEETLGYAGQTFKKSTHTRPAYNNATVNFTIDNKFNNYWVIYKWLDMLNDEKLSQFNGKEYTKKITPEDYQTDISLYAKDEYDKNVVKFTYTKAFPVSLGEINYNYRTAGEVETTFEYAFSQLLIELL
tara:strand:- start:51343 stop:51915 length:573 start_codon:yes stop_codon:yes gene_type:complete